jgi:hypothetical protein
VATQSDTIAPGDHVHDRCSRLCGTGCHPHRECLDSRNRIHGLGLSLVCAGPSPHAQLAQVSGETTRSSMVHCNPPALRAASPAVQHGGTATPPYGTSRDHTAPHVRAGNIGGNRDRAGSSHREGHPDGGRSTIAVGGHRLSWLGPIAAARLPLLGPWPAPALRVRLPPDTGRLAARMMLTVLLTTALECCGRIGTTHRSGSRSGDDPGRLWTRPILLLIRW